MDARIFSYIYWEGVKRDLLTSDPFVFILNHEKKVKGGIDRRNLAHDIRICDIFLIFEIPHMDDKMPTTYIESKFKLNTDSEY